MPFSFPNWTCQTPAPQWKLISQRHPWQFATSRNLLLLRYEKKNIYFLEKKAVSEWGVSPGPVTFWNKLTVLEQQVEFHAGPAWFSSSPSRIPSDLMHQQKHRAGVSWWGKVRHNWTHGYCRNICIFSKKIRHLQCEAGAKRGTSRE